MGREWVSSYSARPMGLCMSRRGIPGEDVFPGLAEDESDGGGIVGVAQEVIHGGTIEVHLPGILGFELACFEVHHDEAAEVQAVKQEVEVEVPFADLQPELAAYEGEAAPTRSAAKLTRVIFPGEPEPAANVPSRKSLLLRKLIFQIRRKPGNDAITPAFLFLLRRDHAADVPIQDDHLRIGGERGAALPLADPGPDVA